MEVSIETTQKEIHIKNMPKMFSLLAIVPHSWAHNNLILDSCSLLVCVSNTDLTMRQYKKMTATTGRYTDARIFVANIENEHKLNTTSVRMTENISSVALIVNFFLGNRNREK